MIWIFVFIGCAGILIMYRSWKFGCQASRLKVGLEKGVDLFFSCLGITVGLGMTIFGSLMSWGMVQIV